MLISWCASTTQFHSKDVTVKATQLFSPIGEFSANVLCVLNHRSPQSTCHACVTMNFAIISYLSLHFLFKSKQLRCLAIKCQPVSFVNIKPVAISAATSQHLFTTARKCKISDWIKCMRGAICIYAIYIHCEVMIIRIIIINIIMCVWCVCFFFWAIISTNSVQLVYVMWTLDAGRWSHSFTQNKYICVLRCGPPTTWAWASSQAAAENEQWTLAGWEMWIVDWNKCRCRQLCRCKLIIMTHHRLYITTRPVRSRFSSIAPSVTHFNWITMRATIQYAITYIHLFW